VAPPCEYVVRLMAATAAFMFVRRRKCPAIEGNADIGAASWLVKTPYCETARSRSGPPAQ
jgi:hypothetical protein